MRHNPTTRVERRSCSFATMRTVLSLLHLQPRWVSASLNESINAVVSMQSGSWAKGNCRMLPKNFVLQPRDILGMALISFCFTPMQHLGNSLVSTMLLVSKFGIVFACFLLCLLHMRQASKPVRRSELPVCNPIEPFCEKWSNNRRRVNAQDMVVLGERLLVRS